MKPKALQPEDVEFEPFVKLEAAKDAILAEREKICKWLDYEDIYGSRPGEASYYADKIRAGEHHKDPPEMRIIQTTEALVPLSDVQAEIRAERGATIAYLRLKAELSLTDAEEALRDAAKEIEQGFHYETSSNSASTTSEEGS